MFLLNERNISVLESFESCRDSVVVAKDYVVGMEVSQCQRIGALNER